MSLLDMDLGAGRTWARVRDSYEVTRKPRGLDLSSFDVVPFAPMEAIPQGGAYAPALTMKALSAITSGTYFERGDLLISKITPSFENGKQAFIRELPIQFGYATTEVIPLRPREKAHDPRLLFFYLLHPDVRHYLAERMEGSTGRQRVPENVLLELPIPVLNSADQKSMADALEALHSASAAELEAQRLSEELKRTAMQALFTRGLRGEAPRETEIGLIPESWEPRSIRQLCEIWSGGTPRKSVVEFWNGDIPWVSGKDLKAPALDNAIDHITSEGVAAGSRLAPKGAVLILVRGMGLAKDLPVAVINRSMAFNQDVKALVPREQLSGQFLRSAIYASKDRLLAKIVPSAHGTMTLNLNDIETLKVPCPEDRAEAEEISDVLVAIDRKIELHRRKQAVLDDLFKALLHKLVTGAIRVADLDLSALEAVQPEEAAA